MADGTEARRIRYWRFEGRSFEGVREYATNSECVRMEFHPGDTPEGATLHFFDAKGVLLGVVNESHPCPPDCGG